MIDYGINVPITSKQLEAMRVIANIDEGGKPLDLDTVLSRLKYKTTKQAFQFTIRSLINRELIVKLECKTIRGKHRRSFMITPLGLNKLHSEFRRAEAPADPKTCQSDEVEKTNLLIAQIEKELGI